MVAVAVRDEDVANFGRCPADPSGGIDDAPLGQWLVAIGICLAICVPLFFLGRHGSPARRAAALGTATGILFALSAAFTKVVADQFEEGVFEIFVHWHLYALVVVGYASMTFNQLALNTGALAPAVATSLAFDPIASVVLGVYTGAGSVEETGYVYTGEVTEADLRARTA